MKNKRFESTAGMQMSESLEPLNIREIEERLEVSSLVPHGDIADTNLFDGENCCHDKCSGNTIDIQIDDPVDTGEIPGGSIA